MVINGEGYADNESFRRNPALIKRLKSCEALATNCTNVYECLRSIRAIRGYLIFSISTGSTGSANSKPNTLE